MICIRNTGEIDIKGLFLMGASTKRDDQSTIGMFGSGNKYAIATLLRKNIPFRIYSGTQEIKITKEKDVLRGQEYEIIVIDGNRTSLTTEMGPQWETWYCIREFVSNAIDEGEYSVTQVENEEPTEGETRIYIDEVGDIEEMINNITDYFCFQEEAIEIIETPKYGTVSVYPNDKEETVFYRKGIRCNQRNTDKSYYRYDFSDIKINESRVYSLGHEPYERIAEYLLSTEDQELIKTYIKHYNVYQDFDRAMFEYAKGRPSGMWYEILKNEKLIPDSLANISSLPLEDRADCISLPDNLIDVIKEYYPDIFVYGSTEYGYIEVKPTAEQMKMVNTGISNLLQVGINIPEGSIKYGKFHRKEVIAKVIENNRIVLSIDHIKSQRFVEMTILE